MMTQTETTYAGTAGRIIHTATRLFMQRGYSAVSINDIVHAAEITKPTLYYHFADKEELFVQTAIHMLAEMHTRMEQALEGRQGIAERLVGLAGVLLETSDGDTRMMRHEAREHLGPSQQRRLGEAFARSMFQPLCREMQASLDRGELKHHNASDLAMLFLCLAEGFLSRPNPEIPPTGIELPSQILTAETLVDLFLHGVQK